MTAGPDGYAGMPRWVKVGGIVLLVVVALAVGAMALGLAGEHGPGRHGVSGGSHVTPNNSSTSTHSASSPVAAGARFINVTAANLAFAPSEITVEAGTDIAIALSATDTRHDFVIDELGAHVMAEKGTTETGGFNSLHPGRYVFYCTEPGHRNAGMSGTLIVEARHA